ncbi:hypothetical protein AMS58_19685 [Pseudoalteromonas porphyrae]|uniref:flagellin N-terminal helical domain-containing protein n=1 Tax=Pseudoalteromonas TaxID=53246 RepID=UPI0006BB0A6D|nr:MULTISPECIES: flagellin [Pseudoalteromonas]KPH92979.1 hypothetical protein AMS58_19685 [Pseudoalteromonas porphyrae]
MLTVNSRFLNTLQSLNISTTKESQFEQLASGKRINSAKDDAAGLQISNRLATQIAVKQQTLRNLHDGISYGQVADAGLEELTTALQRMRTLALQSANGSNAEQDRLALNDEYTALQNHIDSVTNNTEIFGKKPLMSKPLIETNLNNVPLISEAFTNNIEERLSSGYVSLGVIPPNSTNVKISIDSFGQNDDINLFTQTGEHLVGQDLSTDQNNIENQLFTSANGYQGNEAYSNTNLFDGAGFNFPAVNTQTVKGMNFTYSGNGNPGNNNEEVSIANVTEPLLLTIVGNGSFDITVSWDTLGTLSSQVSSSSDGPMLVTSTDRAIGDDGYIIFEDIDASSSSLTIGGTSIATENNAQSAISRIDTALARVGAFRSEVGAKLNSIQTTIRNESNQSGLLSNSKQRIQETDYAKVMAEKISTDIIEQAGILVASQAKNAVKDGILTLLSQIE